MYEENFPKNIARGFKFTFCVKLCLLLIVEIMRLCVDYVFKL